LNLRKKIKELKLKIHLDKEKEEFEMEIFSDSDYCSGDKMNQQQDGISSVNLQFHENRKLSMRLSLSSTEAEYITLSEMVRYT
jgi:hypothetical protein